MGVTLVTYHFLRTFRFIRLTNTLQKHDRLSVTIKGGYSYFKANTLVGTIFLPIFVN